MRRRTNLDVALGRAQKAKSLMPESPSITDTLAWVLYKKGNCAGAATYSGMRYEIPGLRRVSLPSRNDPMARGQTSEGKQPAGACVANETG